jgi:hypothetical protein
MLQSATLAKGVVTGKRTSTHSHHPWIAAISIAILPLCLKQDINENFVRNSKVRLSVAQLSKKQCGKSLYSSRTKSEINASKELEAVVEGMHCVL